MSAFPPLRLIIALAALLPTLAHAQAAQPPDLGGSLFQLLGGLLLVIVLLVATLWLLKRMSQPRGEAAGMMRIVAGTAIGARERVVVLEIGNTWLVLGVAPGRVTALAEVPRGNIPQPPPGPAGTKDFADRLKQLLHRGDAH